MESEREDEKDSNYIFRINDYFIAWNDCLPCGDFSFVSRISAWLSIGSISMTNATAALSVLKSKIDNGLLSWDNQVKKYDCGHIVNIDLDSVFDAARILSRLIERLPPFIECDPARIRQQNNYDVGQEYHNALRQQIIDLITEGMAGEKT